MEVAEGDALRRGAAAIVVGGGADIYSKTIDKAARLEITRVHVQPEGDTVFPGIDPAQWCEAARQDYAAGPGSALHHIDLGKTRPAKDVVSNAQRSWRWPAASRDSVNANLLWTVRGARQVTHALRVRVERGGGVPYNPRT